MTRRDLKNIYLENCTDFLASPLRAFTTAILESRTPNFSCQTTLETLIEGKESIHQTPFILLSEGYHLLSLGLIRILCEDSSDIYEEWLQGKINTYIQANAWKEFQLLAILKAILAHLAGQSSPPLIPQQLKGGAAFLEWRGFWNWGKATHGHHHADLGCLWGLYGHLSQSSLWVDAAKEIASWQLKTLSVEFLPTRSLFTLEENAEFAKILISNYLLFSMVAALTKNGQFKFAAQKQLEYLEQCPKIRVPDEAPLLEVFIQRIACQIPEEKFSLSGWISDQEVGLAGFRSSTETVFCLGKGGQTGLGYLSFSEIGIVNYGPQHFPLGDCQAFGIEESGQGPSTWQLNLSPNGFQLSALARLTPKQIDLTSFANFRNGHPSNIWVDLKHTFIIDEKKLIIEASFLSLHPLQELAFVFFVKASYCCPENNPPIYPKTFEHYRGFKDTLTFKCETESLSIKTRLPLSVEVIPLGGGANFWGADFLVAYPFDAASSSVEWQVSKI